MIRKNWLDCKLIRIKSSTKALFDAFMTSFRPELEICPVCLRKGDCRIHSHYDRYIIDFIAGKTDCTSITVTRVICSCGHTHAVLPDPIIPYRSYSLFFILRVLMEYFLKCSTVEQLCKRFGITPSILYKWKQLFLDHRREWLGLLNSVETGISASLKTLLTTDPFSAFARMFFQKTGLSFLQSHRNPAFFQQRSP